MAKTGYIQQSDIAFSAQLQTFKNNIGIYGPTLGVTAAQVSAQAADADYFDFTLKCQAVVQNSAQQWTAWKGIIRDGGSPPPTGMPLTPAFPTPVTPVASGVEVRFRALVKQIKANVNYNVAVGDMLGIEGAEHTAPDLTTVQPLIAVAISGSHVEVDWGWQGNSAFLDMCEIQVDRGDGKGFGVLAYDTTPGYTDTAPFPATPAKWIYKAIYRVNDAQVGQWSNPVSVAVQV
jgi:hypothetical protein